MMRLLRSAFVIGRRDFTATVLSKTFIFFLLGPLFPLLLGGVFGTIGARVAIEADRPAIAVVLQPNEFAQISAARQRLADAIGEKRAVQLKYFAPEADLAAQQKRLLASSSPPIQAVLSGRVGDAHLAGDVSPGDPTVSQLQLILRSALVPEMPVPQLNVTSTPKSSGSTAKDRALTAQLGQMILFFITILLSGMVLSQLIEEKSNKIIEVIAAAVPIDALFIGKLFAMLAASVLGILVWVSAGALLVNVFAAGGIAGLPPPALGWPAFMALAMLYFAMNYLLLGAAFLTIGAQAATVREVQTLSMPITFAQVLIFGLATVAVGAPDSAEGLAAAIFPLSSPMAMVARAAERPEVWPHVAALLWQTLWVALILHWGAKLFRKTVLKSGPQRNWWRRARA